MENNLVRSFGMFRVALLSQQCKILILKGKVENRKGVYGQTSLTIVISIQQENKLYRCNSTSYTYQREERSYEQKQGT